MGCGGSKEPLPPGGVGSPGTPGGGPDEVNKSTGIDRDLERARQEEEGKVKMLLLGAGESGKSTIFKQMRILYGSPRSDDDLRMYGVVVRSNIIVALRKLCSHLRNLGLEQALDAESAESGSAVENAEEDPSGASPRQAYDELIAHLVDNTAPPAQDANGDVKDWVGQSPRAGLAANNDAKQFLQHVEAIRVLWQSNTMKEVWSKRAAVNVIDSHKEYLNDLSRIAASSYKPTAQDILLGRVRTTQVVMERYRIDGIDFEMYDVGGQRSERRKWIDCFDHVDAVIFVAALSEYDQTLAEAKRTNRMVEALELFRSVCNNRAFANTSIMLFLNKKDIFAEKIMYSDIATQRPFSDYAGPPKDFDHGVLYFIQKFKDCLIDDEFNDSFIHVTCATDTNNMEFVLDSTRTIIMTDNLRRSGFLGTE
mmetsp:Transcript_61441/g.181588  ORF Transcript_61441/g.181588 Transcript_61441/m.181588 type:complete len:423 (-) Transcript_61441:322-1590(-)|eukprot:CAMPEP_0113555876 /NCGR_PEP_ID=MMETSP0015_2-20120614/16954_1 /TAXON_ID=2838 /ORGANISM="Odontella" /LENGTH=422 /DNA_ID=CAMNT_0000457189 /DNA_START=438 /DNA_END=1706 /DNA_ORIENTATION=- /assembly_acc=CAM_ASM_000160